MFLSSAQVFDFVIDSEAPAVEFLSQSHRNSVLEVGTAHLQSLIEFFSLGIECVTQFFSGLDKDVGAEDAAQMNSGRICVVCGLTEVCVVVRVDDGVVTELTAEMFDSEVGDNFVSVHVGGSTCSALQPVSDELVTIFFSVVDELIASPDHCIGNFRFNNAEFLISHRSCFLNISKSDDEVDFLVVLLFSDEEVFFAAKGLDAVVGISRNF